MFGRGYLTLYHTLSIVTATNIVPIYGVESDISTVSEQAKNLTANSAIRPDAVQVRRAVLAAP